MMMMITKWLDTRWYYSYEELLYYYNRGQVQYNSQWRRILCDFFGLVDPGDMIKNLT